MLEGEIPMAICTGLQSMTELKLNSNNFGWTDCPVIQCLIDRGNWITFEHSPQNDGFEFMANCGYSIYSDSLALVALYNSTDGPNWNDNTNWLTGPVKTWSNVIWYNDRVYKIIMTVGSFGVAGNNLNGNLPSEIGYLNEMIQLKIPSSNLTGPIPESIGNCSSLKEINFENNDLSGEIPASIGNLYGLWNIYLENNQLSGNIPEPLGNLHSLMYLDLQNNNLSGNIPESLGDMDGLYRLNLSGNQLTGTIPSELGNMNNMQNIYLHNNQLTGNIPASLNNLGNLNQLLLRNNQLSGSIPGTVGGLNAWIIDLSYNQFSGILPDSIGNLNRYTRLYLNNNSLSGNIPESFGEIENLSKLDLSNNYLESPIPSVFYTGLSNLTSLNIDSNNFNQEDCEAIYNLKVSGKLTTFTHSPQNNGFVFLDDCGPSFYSDSLALVALYNSSNGSNWTNNTNWLSAPLSSWYGITIEGGRVTEINLGNPGNNLSGTIPNDIGYMSELKTIDLSNNQLSGIIPFSLGNLSSLINLILNENQLGGGIPESFGNLNSLVSLNLSNNTLFGSIPEVLGDLNNLEVLILKECQLNSEIPKSMGSLNKLEILDLENNQLSGAIPDELGYLIELKLLSLTANQFNGIIPEGIGNLQNLDALFLDNNQLDSPIPNSFISETFHPDSLHIDYNNFTTFDCELIHELLNDGSWASFKHSPQNDGFDFLVDCESSIVSDSLALISLYNETNGSEWTNNTNWLTGPVSSWYGISVENNRVTEINMGYSGNNLVGFLPNDIGDLSELRELKLMRNQLTGNLPASIGSLHNLQELYLFSNDLSGELPELLGYLYNLKFLSLGENQFNGVIPESFGNLASIEELDLYYNQLSGTLPESLGYLSNLENLILSLNQLSGSIPESFGNLSNLSYLNLEANNLTGNIPESFGYLSNLQSFNVQYNQLIGSIPESLGNLSNLSYLNLDGNELTGSIPESFEYLGNLEGLYLANNQLSGSIPENFGFISNLYWLDLSGNQLSGSIPESLGNLSNLEYLRLGDNQLTGNIPESFDGLNNLESLYLYDNLLSGSIPAGLGDLSNLSGLNLSNNQLSGSIPESLENLSNLEYLGLSDNQLTGSIPESFGGLITLESLGLSNNQLSGSIPMSICTGLQSMNRLTLNNNNFDQESCAVIQCLIERGGWYYFEHSPQNDGFVFMEDCCEDATTYAGEDAEMCESDSYVSLNGTAENYSEILWTTNGSGYFDPPASLQPKYYPSILDIIQGEVEICLTAIAEYTCQDASDCLTLTFIPVPVVYAGEDQTIISNETATLTAFAENYNELLWETNGDGSFSDETIANPEYTPGENDIETGNVELCITASPISPCAYDSTDCLTLTIVPDIIADFSATPESGVVPFEVQYTDLTEGNPSTWQWDFENDGTIDSEEQNPTWIYEMPGIYSVSLFVSNEFDNGTEVKTDYIVVDFNAPATILSITDVPDDQGGWVYVHFLRSAFDTDTLQKSVEIYNVEMWIDNAWVTANNVGAYGANQYTALCHTPVDSSQYTPGLIEFRVIAIMEEGNFASAVSQGYSVDNLSPEIPQNLNYDILAEDLSMTWDPCPDFDFVHFAIYKSNVNGEFPDLPYATTLESTFSDQLAYPDSAFYVISAIDLRGNESDFSEQIRITPRVKWELPAGWSGISSYLDPTDPALPNIFQDVLDELIIVQTETEMYWPAQNVNTIGNWNSMDGYKIKVSDNIELEMAGNRPQYSNLNLSEGWSLIPVLSECDVDVENFFNFAGLIIVKEVAGTRVFWPGFGINTLGELNSGHSYFVLMNTDVEIAFPGCEQRMTTSPMRSETRPPLMIETEGKVYKTPITHTIAIPKSAIEQLEIEPGYLIAALDEHDSCCGIVEWQNQSTVLTLFGDDPLSAEKDGALENEYLSFMIINPENRIKHPVDISWDVSTMHSDGQFHAHGLSAISGINTTNINDLSGLGQIQLFPNPAKDEVTFLIDLEQLVYVEFLNQLGKKCLSAEISKTKTKIDISGLSPGIYLVTIVGDQGKVVKKLVVK